MIKPRVRLQPRYLLMLGLLALAWLTLAQTALAQAPDATHIQRITDRLNCPLCQGRTLTECEIPVCVQMKSLIQQKLAAGVSDDEIMQYFVIQYGQQVLNEPTAIGFNLLVWVFPLIGMIAGAIIVAVVLRNVARRKPAEAPAATRPLPEEYLRRVEQELKDF
ncbi:MAG: hypothetical protein EXR62_08325 [Chloroflexi bacterium]|nr:hypothetical protein [Chloroflexota bacterium]